MFESLSRRVAVAAEQRTRARISALAERMQAELSRGARASAEAEGVRIEGRGLRRRFAVDPALRWLRERLR